MISLPKYVALHPLTTTLFIWIIINYIFTNALTFYTFKTGKTDKLKHMTRLQSYDSFPYVFKGLEYLAKAFLFPSLSQLYVLEKTINTFDKGEDK